MELKNCNKKELMYIIDKYIDSVLLEAALSEIEYMRIKLSHEEFMKWLERQKEIRKKISELREPYVNGEKRCAISKSVQKQIDLLEDEDYELTVKCARKLGVRVK